MPDGITLAMMTCRRLPLFKRTLKSLAECCEDLHRLSEWVLIDNGSSAEDLRKMRAIMVDALPHLPGDLRAMPGATYRAVREALYEAVKTPLVFDLEDDWEFYRKGAFLTESLRILAADQRVKEVAFRYFPCPVVTVGGVTFRLHEYLGKVGPDPDVYDCHWEGFTFNPSVQVVESVRACLPFADQGVERHLAGQFRQKGFGVAHTWQGYVRHIGTVSAFSLTGHSR